jgi:hypothetical protein
VTSAGDVAAEKVLRSIRGLLLLLAVVASRYEDALAPHSFMEDFLHLTVDLAVDSQKAFESHKPWAHDLHHFLSVLEGVLVDVLVDGVSQLLG